MSIYYWTQNHDRLAHNIKALMFWSFGTSTNVSMKIRATCIKYLSMGPISKGLYTCLGPPHMAPYMFRVSTDGPIHV